MPKKKRIPTLSALDKAFAIAANFPSKAPDRFKQYLSHLRDNQKPIMKALNINSFGETPNIISPYIREYFSFIGNEEAKVVGRYRDLMLSFWWSKRNCYTFSNQTLTFIDESFPAERMKYSCAEFIYPFCKNPIYIEFPQGAPVRGAFCGCGADFRWESSNEMRLLHLVIVLEDKAIVNITGLNDVFIHDLLQNEKSEEDIIKYVLKAFIYLSYVEKMSDSPGRILNPYPRQNCACYKVEPIPYQDWEPVFADSEAWMRNGFCQFLRYLSRRNMLEEYSKEIAAHPELNRFPYTEDGVDLKKYVRHQFEKAVINWENNRIVYQYSKDTSELLVQENLSKLQTKGIFRSLIRYLPTSTITLYLKEWEAIFIASVTTDGDKNSEKLLCTLIYNGYPIMKLIRLDVPYRYIDSSSSKLNGSDDVFIRSLCALLHLLSVLERNTIKKFQQDYLSQGNPNLEDLVPITEKVPSNRGGRQKESGQDSLRVGAAVCDIPFKLFTMTPAGIKKASKKEVGKITRWTMVPHVRRGHLHHYWVGKGSERHLEARWLEATKINCKTGVSPVPTIKELK